MVSRSWTYVSFVVGRDTFYLGKGWLYNSCGYEFANQITEKVLGMSWSGFLWEKIMDTLGTKGTTSNVAVDSENVAKAYIALSEAIMCLLPRPQLEAVCGSCWYTKQCQRSFDVL